VIEMLFLQNKRKVWLDNTPLEHTLERLNHLNFDLQKEITVMTIFIGHNEQVLKLTRYYEILTNLKVKTSFENNMLYVYVTGRILDVLGFIYLLENQIDISIADSFITRDIQLLRRVRLNKKMDVRANPESSLVIRFLRDWNLDDGYYIIDALASVKDIKKLESFLRKTFEKIYKCKPEDVFTDDNLTLDAISVPLLEEFRVANSEGR